MPLRVAIVPSICLALALDLAAGGEAWAQVSPSPLPPTSAEAPQEKKPGVAEQAERSPDELPTTPVLPPIRNERKRFQLFELDGYYRLRTNWFRNFHLGFDDQGPGGAPYPRPLSCAQEGGSCGDTLQSADMRLRLEPTINITETSKVFLQIDVLDNVVLGSTPVTRVAPGSGTGVGVPSGFDNNQAPPEAGVSDYADSIRVKRAWAEIQTSLGQLTFGRQPWHWGLGIYANAGGHDPFSDMYDLDADFGDTVDRVMFRTRIPGTRIDAALAMDWGATAPTAAQTGLYLDDTPHAGRVGGRPLDLDDADDVSQWTFMLTRFDAPELFQEQVERGEWAFNYGAFLVYRTQDWETRPITGEDGTTELQIVRRGLETYTPDAWFRVAKGNLQVEGEAVLTLGSVENVSDLVPERTGEVTLRRFGAVARARYRALDGAMHFGLEGGLATGDIADANPPGAMHVGNLQVLDPANGSTLSTFLFDYDYNIDLILFREIIGAVTNAIYVRPSVQYQVSEDIHAELSGVISGAFNPEGTPGNGRMYGVELDAKVGYRRDGFFVGLAGGALFPFAALSHVGAAFEPTDPNDDDAIDNTGDASNAYTIQSILGLTF